MSENDKVLEALRQIPEVQLSLISLAWEVCPEGELDLIKLTENALEIEMAVKEAQAYSRHTKEAVWGLTKLAHSIS